MQCGEQAECSLIGLAGLHIYQTADCRLHAGLIDQAHTHYLIVAM